MMRTILFGVLMLGAASVWADWVKVTETGDTAYYVDPASISDKGAFRRVSVIQDYAMQESGGVRSRRVSYDIDCAGGRLRSVAATEYTEPMAQGKSATSWERESAWLYVAPRTGSNVPSRTPYRAILGFVCSR
jgi:hypothetical protein